MQTYLNVILNDKEKETLLAAKEKSGIKGTADLVRFLLKSYVEAGQ